MNNETSSVCEQVLFEVFTALMLITLPKSLRSIKIHTDTKLVDQKFLKAAYLLIKDSIT